VVDVTGSMAVFHHALKAALRDFPRVLMDEVRKAQNVLAGLKLSLRLACVPFREAATDNSTPVFGFINVDLDDSGNDDAAVDATSGGGGGSAGGGGGKKGTGSTHYMEWVDYVSTNLPAACGGGDAAEDPVAALQQVNTGSLVWGKGSRFVVLLTDAPGHGVLNGDKSAFSDHKPSHDSSGREYKALMKSMAEDNVHFVFARLWDTATRHMETLLRKAFVEDGYEGDESRATNRWTSVDVCPGFAGRQRTHHVFVLDESWSMQGAPFNRLQEAFQRYKSVMKGLQRGDIFSVVMFNDSYRVIQQYVPLKQLGSLTYGSGGTSFEPALRKALELFSRQPTYCVTHAQYNKQLLWMTDGEAGYSPVCKEMRAAGVKIRACLLGSGGAVMQRMAVGDGGGDFQVVTQQNIVEFFEKSAQISATSITTAVAANVGETVARKLLANHL
jgi:uncharacterized protein YegL